MSKSISLPKKQRTGHCMSCPLFSMVGPGRFELPTSRLSSARSNQLSYEPVPEKPIEYRIKTTVRSTTGGGAERDRTDDLLLAKQALSQLSYGPILNAMNRA